MCLSILILAKENYAEEDIIDELKLLQKYIQRVNQTEFEDWSKLINYINRIATQIYNPHDTIQLKISVLLHTLTFKIKGKHISVKTKWII